MKSCFFPIISVALFMAGVSAQLTFNVITEVFSCAPLQISFDGGTPPYVIRSVKLVYHECLPFYSHTVSTFSIYTGPIPNGDPLRVFSDVLGSPYIWPVINFPPGTYLVLAIRDNYGEYALSAPFSVNPGIRTDCLNGPATSPNAPSANPSTSAAAMTTGTIPVTKAGRGPITSSLSSASKAASPSSSANIAIVPGIPYGVPSVLGVVIAAIFV